MLRVGRKRYSSDNERSLCLSLPLSLCLSRARSNLYYIHPTLFLCLSCPFFLPSQYRYLIAQGWLPLDAAPGGGGSPVHAPTDTRKHARTICGVLGTTCCNRDNMVCTQHRGCLWRMQRARPGHARKEHPQNLFKILMGISNNG
jgi:hypothetical protein